MRIDPQAPVPELIVYSYTLYTFIHVCIHTQCNQKKSSENVFYFD